MRKRRLKRMRKRRLKRMKRRKKKKLPRRRSQHLRKKLHLLLRRRMKRNLIKRMQSQRKPKLKHQNLKRRKKLNHSLQMPFQQNQSQRVNSFQQMILSTKLITSKSFSLILRRTKLLNPRKHLKLQIFSKLMINSLQSSMTKIMTSLCLSMSSKRKNTF
jgi:hypothetical protein